MLALAAALVLSLAGVSAAGPASGDSQRLRPTVAIADAGTAPPGWSLRTAPDGARLEWRSDQVIPIGDAAVEFWWGQVLLGTPQPLADGRTFRLEVESLPGADLGALRVTRGGVPLGRDGLVARTAPFVTTGGAELRREWQRQQLLSQDPGRPGRFDTASSNYQLAQVPFHEYAAPLDIVGRVVRPVGADGPRPLVVFLHGRHGTCYKGNRSTGEWPCRSGWEPIPSHLGYLSMQRLLASQGYTTVSIDANAINGQDWQSPDGGAAARSTLVRKHLQAWNTWSTVGAAPFGADLVGTVDMSRVVLVGHSRGGEGVNRAAVDSRPASDWRIAGQVLIGPTAFGRQIKPGVPTVALLPFCDGDVSDLQGQQYVDMSRDILDDTDQALRSSVMVMGANHNYFNAEWTPGVSQAPSFDDWGDRGDSQCGVRSEARLSAAEQRDVGATYVAAATHLFAVRDLSALPLLDGSGVRVPSSGSAVVFSHAIGGARSPVYLPARADSVSARGGVDTRTCLGWGTRAERCARESSPHFLPMDWQGRDPAPSSWEVSWTKAAGSAAAPLGTPMDLSNQRQVELRVAAPPGEPSVRFELRVSDASGRQVTLGSATVRGLPVGRSVRHLWARTARFTLPDSVTRLGDITQLTVVPRSSSGHLWVLDAHTRRFGLPSARVGPLPRLDAVSAQVQEGDNGTHTVDVLVNVKGVIEEPAKVWVGADDPSGGGQGSSQVLTLAPGVTSFTVPIEVEGDTRDDYDSEYMVAIRALSHVYTGSYLGSVQVLDDDPASLVSVNPDVATVEGGQLRWGFTLDRPSDVFVALYFEAIPPSGGLVELSTDDVRRQWLERCGRVPATPKPLSTARLYCTSVYFDPTRTETRLSVPTSQDGLVEGPEVVRFQLVEADPAIPGPPLELTGTVTDN